MRILHREPREGAIRLRAESLDDLWELSHIISSGDSVRARTERKVAVGGDKKKQERKPMTLTVTVEKTELEGAVLRVHGVISEGPEDLISFGDHHSIAVQAGTEIEIRKEWDAVDAERLASAEKSQPLNILLVTFDREEAVLAELTRRGYDIVQKITGEVAKKQEGGGTEDFWKKLSDVIVQLDERKHYHSIVAASPAFWNEYLVKALPSALQEKTSTASCSSVGEGAIKEVLKRPELAAVLEKDRTSQEESLVHDVLAAVHKEKACYGKDDCEEKAANGQITMLIVSMNLVQTAREEGWYEELDSLLEQAKSTKAEVRILQHVVDQLDALGGIAGILRW